MFKYSIINIQAVCKNVLNIIESIIFGFVFLLPHQEVSGFVEETESC